MSAMRSHGFWFRGHVHENSSPLTKQHSTVQ